MKETQVEISKKKQESKEKSKTKIKNNMYLNNKRGITLIALVVTIVVILILAGITIQTAIGDGGIINLANEAKEQQIIASYKDRIGIVGVNWSLNRALDDSVTVDDLWQDMQDAKIINNKETDVEKVDENGNYIITVPEGYKFQIHINEYDDLEIDYIGKEDNLLPYINEIKVINQTSNSVELQVSVSRLNNGTLNYYYKEKDAPDEDYQLVKGDTTDLTATITGLTDKTTYEIKIEATNENGTTEKEIEVLIGELKGTVTQKGETVWSNGTATIHLETEAQNLSILYQINSIEGTYQPYDDTKGITGLGHGDTVFAVLSDGTNITDYTSIDVLDKIGPTVTVTQGSKSTNNIQVSVSSSDAEWGMSDSITYNYYIKQNSAGSYPTDPTHTGTETSYTFTGLIQNTSYDVKVTTNDKAGNPGEGQVTNITTDTVGGADDDLKEGNIIASEPTWSNGSASITLSKGTEVASSLTIQYQVGDIAEGNWTTAQAGAASVTVTRLKHNDIVYARLTDGTNYGSYASVTILDKISPKSAKINLSTNTTKEKETITATVTHTDNESGVNITNCKWVYNTTSTPIGTEEGSYTGGNFSSNGETINLTASTVGTYYLHVLTIDVAGNKTETISNAVTVEKKIISDGSFSEEKGVNTPDLADGKLTPVVYDEKTETWVEAQTIDEWYDYSTGAKKWANAITEDGSMWVWIPRYAYQISSLYHSDSKTSGGNINIKFMKGTSNIAADGTSTWQNKSGQDNWNIHPGFEYSSTAPGLWVAKFEASRSDATNSSEGSETIIKIQPGVESWRNISINDVYNICLNYNSNLNSHLIKNTEWGAVTYLAQSSYGKNAEVWRNPSFITGYSVDDPNAGLGASKSPYNRANGPQASTTGNVYGVYDMSGGSFEMVAGYVANNNENLTKYGSSLVNGASHTKDVYTSNGDTLSGNYNAASDRYGDAVYETSLSDNSTSSGKSWYRDRSVFPNSSSPFFNRGENNLNTYNSGLFAFGSYNGNANINYSFRPVLIVL